MIKLLLTKSFLITAIALAWTPLTLVPPTNSIVGALRYPAPDVTTSTLITLPLEIYALAVAFVVAAPVMLTTGLEIYPDPPSTTSMVCILNPALSNQFFQGYSVISESTNWISPFINLTGNDWVVFPLPTDGISKSVTIVCVLSIVL